MFSPQERYGSTLVCGFGHLYVIIISTLFIISTLLFIISTLLYYHNITGAVRVNPGVRVRAPLRYYY